MLTNRLSFCVALLIGLLSCRVDPGSATKPVPPAPTVPLIHRDGPNLVLNGQPIQLNGVAFGNWVWDNAAQPPTLHHNQQDFARLKDMGLNCVRFYLHYRWFEDDAKPYTYKQTAWAWLDQNIAWARQNGIYLILNFHAPQGGYQSQGNGQALWDNVENQNRLAALWREIARRYANEPAIAGYDLVNEPITTRSIDQWKDLAQRLTNTIREVDGGHLIVVERLNAVDKVWKDYNGEQNMFLINDNNVLYQFHFYSPFEYTHQLFSWGSPGDGGPYPDENRIATSGGFTWHTAIFTNPALPSGSTAWTFYEGVRFQINDPKMSVATAVCVAANLQNGRAYFDDVIVKEYDPAGRFVRDVLTLDFSSPDGWYFWSSNGAGASAPTTGRSGQCLSVAQTTADANISFGQTKFVPKQGYSYQVSGWMKGENIPATANARLRIDFETSALPVLTRGKAALKNELQFYADWGRKNNVPIYLGEFGTGAACFQQGKGGVQWTSDMIDLNRELGFHSTYHAYHEDSFGWYFGYLSLPAETNANTALIDLFRKKFGR